MMMYMFSIMLIMPLCLFKNMCWMVQNLLFLLSFMMIMMNMYNDYYSNISYSFGSDLISYGLVLLCLWIISLMIMASEKIINLNNYKNFLLLMFYFYYYYYYNNNK